MHLKTWGSASEALIKLQCSTDQVDTTSMLYRSNGHNFNVLHVLLIHRTQLHCSIDPPDTTSMFHRSTGYNLKKTGGSRTAMLLKTGVSASVALLKQGAP